MDAINLTATSGRKMLMKILRPGDGYGLRKCMTWGAPDTCICDPAVRAKLHERDKDKLGVEVYDQTYAGQTGFDPEGQFTGARYYLETLMESTGGLIPQGGVSEWNIPATEMIKFRIWAQELGLVHG
jgi:hypothetical protein